MLLCHALRQPRGGLAAWPCGIVLFSPLIRETATHGTIGDFAGNRGGVASAAPVRRRGQSAAAASGTRQPADDRRVDGDRARRAADRVPGVHVCGVPAGAPRSCQRMRSIPRSCHSGSRRRTKPAMRAGRIVGLLYKGSPVARRLSASRQGLEGSARSARPARTARARWRAGRVE